VITLLLACQLLVSSIDFSFRNGAVDVNPEKIQVLQLFQNRRGREERSKIQFVREKMGSMDYKNMRDLLRLLLVDKLDKMPGILDEFQHEQLLPVEELMLDLIDRERNFCPALFFITEISRINQDSSVHFLPVSVHGPVYRLCRISNHLLYTFREFP